MNYSPPLRYDFPKPKNIYTNTINMIPPTNLFHQIHKSGSLSGKNTQNIAYNRNFSNTNINTNSPFLVRNYSTSFINDGNIHNLNLNQIYRANSPITNTNPTAINNTQINLNYNRLYINTNNSNNSVYSLFKNNNINNNIFYSPQKGNNPNQNLILNLKSNKSNQKINFHPTLNLNGNIHTFFTPIPHPSYNNINSYNLTQPNIISNNNINNVYNLGTIKKVLFQNGQTNNNDNNNRELNLKINNISIDNNIKKDNNNRTIKSDEMTNSNLQTIEKPKENFDPNEFIIIKRIGEGTYGKIYLTQWKKNNKKYAMKKEIIKGNESLKKKKEKTKIVTNFINKTGSKGVIKIYGDLVKKKGNVYNYYVLMEIADRDWEKELFERQKLKQYYSEKEIFIIMNQLIKTLSLLQKNHITHRDIKPQNVLITKGIYKISDFGEARTLLREGIIVSRVRGTELYMSPILFNGLRLKLNQIIHNTFKSDVFSLGMCLLFATTLTFNSLCDIRELNDMKIIKEKLMKYLSGKYSLRLINILNEMLQIEENNRPDFIILEKKYFS